MGILNTLEKRQGFGPADDFWYRPTWMSGAAGSKEASPEQALSVSAWFCGISIIAGTMGSMPLKLYRRNGAAREEVKDDPRHWLMYRRPNRFQTAFEWREMCQGHLLARGNAYSRIVRDRAGRPTDLLPLHPDRVEVRVEAGEVVYKVQTTTGEKTYPAKDVLHMRGMGGNGLTGWSVAALARRSLGYALQLENHGSELMGNKARPGGVLSTDQVLKKETKDALAQGWDSMFTGGGLGKTAVIDAGLSWQQVGFSAEDAQFLDSRKFQITDVARWLNIPPHFLKDLERATFGNIEQQSLEFAVHTIRPWAERWEQRLDLAFLEDDERGELFYKFSLDALLRGDQESRANFYQSLFNMGSLSPNDIRAKEDMNPVEGGDQRFVQLNLMPLEQAGELVQLPTPSPPDSEPPQRSAEHRTEDRAWEMRTTRSARLRLRFRQTHQRLMQNAAERLVKREVQDLRRLLDAVEDGDVDEFLRRLDRYTEGLPATARKIMAPLLAAYIDLVADAAAEEVELNEIDEARVEAWKASYIDGFTQAHTTETAGKLRDTMTEAGGDPFTNARGMLDRWDEQRGAAIAAREAVTAGGGAAVMVYALAGMGAVWRNTGTEDCPYCEMLEGRTVRVGERFLREGETLDPGGVDPLTVKRSVGHPSAHKGCDCYVQAWRG